MIMKRRQGVLRYEEDSKTGKEEEDKIEKEKGRKTFMAREDIKKGPRL